MKILTIFSGKEFIIEDEEIKVIIIAKQSGNKAFLELRCGAFVDTSAIESITDIPLIPFFGGDKDRMSHYLLKDGNGNYFYEYEGKRRYISLEEVEFLEDPKYQELIEAQLKRLENKKQLKVGKKAENN